MKNRLVVVTCYILFFFTSHTASGFTCPEAFKNPKKALSQAVEYIFFQSTRISIKYHQRQLMKELKRQVLEFDQFMAEYHLDALLHISENPRLTTEQQRVLKTGIANFLLANYQRLYYFTNYDSLLYKHGTSVEAWIYVNGNSAIRDKALTVAKNFNRLKDSYIYPLTHLHRILLDLSTKEGIGFSPEVLAYFDALPLREKVQLVGTEVEPPKLNNPKAQSLIESWGRSVRLHAGREKVQDKLSEDSHRSFDIRPIEEYVANELGLDGGLGYYNQSVMMTLMRRQFNDKTSYENPIVQQLYILVEHRLKNALTVSDKGRQIEESRLKEPSAIAILSILGEVGKDHTMAGSRWIRIPQSKQWQELKDLINQSFSDPHIRAYLSSLLPAITTYFDLLSSSPKDSKEAIPSIDIFADSNHNLSSFIQN